MMPALSTESRLRAAEWDAMIGPDAGPVQSQDDGHQDAAFWLWVVGSVALALLIAYLS